MRHLLFATFCILLACCAESPAERTLGRASSLLPEYPDSAEVVLNSIPAGSGEAEDARIALYRVWIANRRGDNLSNDSLLETANTYFQDHRDESPRDRMILYYLKGLSRLERKNYGGAIISLLRAEELAQQLDDNHHLGLIYRYMSDIYDHTYSQRNALKYSRQSYDCFIKTNNRLYIDYALNDLATTYVNSLKLDSALIIAKKVYKTGKENNDTILAVSALSIMANAYVGLEDYKAAYKVMSYMEQTYGIKSQDENKSMANICMHIGNYPLAEKHLQRLDNSLYLNLLKSQLYESKDQYEDAYKSLKLAYNNIDSIFEDIIHESTTKQAQDYYRIKEKRTKRILRNDRIKIGILLTLILIVILFSITILYFRNALHKKDVNEKIMLIYQLSESLKYSNNALIDKEAYIQSKEDSFKKEILKVFASKFEILDKLCNSYYEVHGTSGEKNKIYNRVLNEIQSIRNNSEVIATIERNINENMDNIVDNIQKDIPTLSSDDKMLFMYICIGLSSRSISTIFDIKIEAVYNRKARLKKKIETLNKDSKYSYLKIIQTSDSQCTA